MFVGSGGQTPSEGSTNCSVHGVTNRVIQRRTIAFSFVSASFTIYKSWSSGGGGHYSMVVKGTVTVELLQNY